VRKKRNRFDLEKMFKLDKTSFGERTLGEKKEKVPKKALSNGIS